LATSEQLKPVALVTGAGAPRIGNCVARVLAARGYQLAIHANHALKQAEKTVHELEESGTTAIAVRGNLAEEQEVHQLVQTVIERFGHIEALVNSAGIWKSGVLEDVTAEDVRSHFDVNTLATFLCCQKVGLQMVSQDHGGSIVNIGDWSIVRPCGDYSAYYPSKGAIPALTRSFAVELARRNPCVRVNAVLPGPVLFPENMPEDERQAEIAGTLVKREGTPRNVADAVAFLLENDFITGVSLPVDGGRSIYSE
jgi:pteridine reductase